MQSLYAHLTLCKSNSTETSGSLSLQRDFSTSAQQFHVTHKGEISTSHNSFDCTAQWEDLQPSTDGTSRYVFSSDKLARLAEFSFLRLKVQTSNCISGPLFHPMLLPQLFVLKEEAESVVLSALFHCLPLLMVGWVNKCVLGWQETLKINLASL